MTTFTTKAVWPTSEDVIREDAGSQQVKKTRVQLDLHPRAAERLNDLKEKTEAVSYVEVIKNALKLYDGIITEVENGNEFYIKDSSGNIVPFRMFI